MKEGSTVSSYDLISSIGSGGFGSVWRVRSSIDGREFAMKIEQQNSPRRTLQFEIGVLKKLRNSPRFPKYEFDGVEDDITYLVMELLGPDLTTIMKSLPQKHFSPEYIPSLASCMLMCIRDLHAAGYIHRDIKPQNFVVRITDGCPVCLLDFGISKLFHVNGQHVAARNHADSVGTPLFTSPNSHSHIDQSRRDDLISLMYTIAYLAGVELPWSNNLMDAMALKNSNPISSLVAPLGQGFVDAAKHIESLQYEDTPDYNYILECFKSPPIHQMQSEFEWQTIGVGDTDVEKTKNDPTGFLHMMVKVEKEKKCLLL